MVAVTLAAEVSMTGVALRVVAEGGEGSQMALLAGREEKAVAAMEAECREGAGKRVAAMLEESVGAMARTAKGVTVAAEMAPVG